MYGSLAFALNLLSKLNMDQLLVTTKCTITSLTCTYFLRYPLQVLKQVCQDTIPSVLDNKEQFCNSTAYKLIHECGGSHRAQSELKTPFTFVLYYIPICGLMGSHIVLTIHPKMAKYWFHLMYIIALARESTRT